MSNYQVHPAFRQFFSTLLPADDSPSLMAQTCNDPLAAAMYADRQMQDALVKRNRELEHDNAELQRQLIDAERRLQSARRAMMDLSKDIDDMAFPGYELQLPGQIEWTPIPQHITIAGVKQLVIEKSDALEAIVEQKYLDWLRHEALKTSDISFPR